jgi:hypothetical protein
VIDDERPALIHTGMYGLYEGVRDGIAEVLDPSKLEPKRLREAKHRLEEELSFEQRANDLYEAWRERETRKRGRGQMAPGAVRPYVPPDSSQGNINVTDPDSRLMKDSRGFVQGYNAQVTVNEKQIVLAAE